MRSRRLDRAEVGHDMAAHRASGEEYLAIDAASPTKNEYFDGQILAMAGGSEEHALLSMNMGVALPLALRGRTCRVYSSDLRVRVAATGLGTYPDVTVVCGASQRNGETVLNPIVIVEVPSLGVAVAVDDVYVGVEAVRTA